MSILIIGGLGTNQVQQENQINGIRADVSLSETSLIFLNPIEITSNISNRSGIKAQTSLSTINLFALNPIEITSNITNADRIKIDSNLSTINLFALNGIQASSNYKITLIRPIQEATSILSEYRYDYINEISSSSNLKINILQKIEASTNTTVIVTLIIDALSSSAITVAPTQLDKFIFLTETNSSLNTENNILEKEYGLIESTSSNITFFEPENFFYEKLISVDFGSNLLSQNTLEKIYLLEKETSSNLTVEEAWASKTPLIDVLLELEASVLSIIKDYKRTFHSFAFSDSDLLVIDIFPEKESGIYVYTNTEDFTAMGFDIEIPLMIYNTILIKPVGINYIKVYASESRFTKLTNEIYFPYSILKYKIENQDKALLLTGVSGDYYIHEIIENKVVQNAFLNDSYNIKYNGSVDDLRMLEDDIFLIDYVNRNIHIFNIVSKRERTITITDFNTSGYNIANPMFGSDIAKKEDYYLISAPGVFNISTPSQNGMVLTVKDNLIINK